jgi:CDP-diacylglycerol--glycerol-3-phosphate 3-phosphatidyltransferase
MPRVLVQQHVLPPGGPPHVEHRVSWHHLQRVTFNATLLLRMSRSSTSFPPALGPFWTVPNALSLARIVLVVPITYLIAIDGPVGWLVSLIVAGALTDWLDGRIARWARAVSGWGKVLDPIADKLGGFATVSALVFRPAEPHLPLWFLLLLVVRDVLIVAGSLILARTTGAVAMSQWWGKAASLWLALTVLAAVLRADAPVLDACLYVTSALLAISFVVYTGRFAWAMVRTRPRRHDDAPPPNDADASNDDADARATASTGETTEDATPEEQQPA